MNSNKTHQLYVRTYVCSMYICMYVHLYVPKIFHGITKHKHQEHNKPNFEVVLKSLMF